jgi:hypothetical protein
MNSIKLKDLFHFSGAIKSISNSKQISRVEDTASGLVLKTGFSRPLDLV